jgi:macrolide transport system ATP-binding/permease protein
MRQLRAWLVRLGGFFRRNRRDGELTAELESHLQLHIEDNLRAGMSAVEARREAHLKLGGLEQTKEMVRERNRLPVLEVLLQDLRFGTRMLMNNPGFTAVAVLTLALGIGMNTGIFTILNGAAVRLLPVPHAEQLLAVSQSYRKLDGPIQRNVRENASFFSYSEYRAYRDRNRVFSGLLAYAPFVEVTLGGAHPQKLQGALASCNYFDVLEVPPVRGRGFTDAECSAPNASPVVVLSDTVWRGAFGADPSLVGKPIILNRTPVIVVGIAPPGFQGSEPVPSQFWAPLTMQSSLLRGEDRLGDDKQSWLGVVGRIKPGISEKQVLAGLGVIAAQIDRLDPGRVTTVAAGSATLFSVPEERFALFSAGGVVLFAVGMILLIACANVSSLLLARASGRRKEVAVRLAMGASRWRLIRQLLTESLLVALLAGILGSLISFWSAAGLMHFLQSIVSPGFWPVALNITPDLHVLAYALGLTLLTGIAFGLVPALQSSRADLTLAMKGESAESGAKPRSKNFLRSALVAAQVAACMVLLLAAGLLLRGLHRANTIDPGFRMKNIASISFDLNGAGYNDQRAEALQRQLLERIRALPGVDAVAQASAVPLDDNHSVTDFSIPGREDHILTEYNQVSPGFFPLLDIRIMRGRNFTDAENQAGAPVAILPESTARRLWPGQDPVGKTLVRGSISYEIVGVVKDAQVSFLGGSDEVYSYFPAGPKEQMGLRLLISGVGANAPTAQTLSATVAALDPELAVEVVNLADNLEPWRTPGRIVSALSAVLSALALVLSSIGVFGLVSYMVSRRVREIGIRMALGADKRDVMILVLRQAMRPVAIGTVLGIASCAALAWIVSTALTADISGRLLYGISPLDPVSFLLVPAFLLSVAVLASYIPARRAMRVDPMVALRYE